MSRKQRRDVRKACICNHGPHFGQRNISPPQIVENAKRALTQLSQDGEGPDNVALMSSPPIDPRQLAALSRVELATHEEEIFREQLSSVVGYLESLQEIELDEVEEFVGSGTSDSSLRPDIEGVTLDRERALQSAPAKHREFIAVPKFVES